MSATPIALMLRANDCRWLLPTLAVAALGPSP